MGTDAERLHEDGIGNERFRLLLMAHIEAGLLKFAVERWHVALRGISNTSAIFYPSIFNTCPIQQRDNQHGHLLCVRQICFVTMALLNSPCALRSIMNLVKSMLDLSGGEGSLKNPPTQTCIGTYRIRCSVSQSVLKTTWKCCIVWRNTWCWGVVGSQL